MAGRVPMRRLLSCAIVVLTAGCAAGTGPPSVSVPPTPAEMPAVTPMTSPSAAVSNAAVPAVRTLFSGTEDCGFPDGLNESTKGGITTYTGRIACTLTMSDPRASGEETGEITMVYLDMPGYKIDKWWGSVGTGTLTNARGSWRRTEAFGSEFWDESDAVRTTGTAGYVGEGGYAGLRMRTLFAQGTLEGDAYVVVGWIEPAD